jgi:hypothetical protein
MTRIRKTHRLAALLAVVAALSTGLAGPASAALAGTISGTVFQDGNRNGVQDAGEPGWEGHQLYLSDASGAYVANTSSDASGHYTFAGLADGDYTIAYASPSWWAIRDTWVPTTTGSIRPYVAVRLSGSATVPFGWRTIVRSTNLAAPFSTFTGPSGLRVQSFDDVVSAKEIHDAVAVGLVGQEARFVTVRFDYSANSSTTAGWQGTPGTYSNYSAVCYDNYISWIDAGDQGVSHEYGHAWSQYYDTIVQQEGTLASYLQARGLAGDSRVNSSYEWSAREMVAEDYRQLFGSPNAQAAAQMNRSIPRAADVPGLKDFLATTFTQPPSGSGSNPTPPPAPAVFDVSNPVVTPTPVVKSGTILSSLSEPATVTIEVRDAGGVLVRTLLSSATRPAGGVSAAWDRKDASGRRAKPGTYSALVRAVTADGRTDSASTAFNVS